VKKQGLHFIRFPELYILILPFLLSFITAASFAEDGVVSRMPQINMPMQPDTGSLTLPSLPGSAGAWIDKGAVSTVEGSQIKGLSKGGTVSDGGQQPGTPQETSVFERYISERLDITKKQLEILKLQPGVFLSLTPQVPLPPGYVMFYIPVELGGGYIYGTQETLANGFKVAGIGSPLYISTEIKQFGYNLFEQPLSTYAPVDSVPVGPEYIIGPGDEIRIAIWGKVNAEFSLIIDNDGKVNIPTVGVLHIAGLSFNEAKSLIEKEFSRYYTDLKINISMGKLKSIMVFVVGNVNKPGTYTISSFSTIINALFAAGGPSKVGTMRDIELKRNGNTVVSLDLYDFLLKGDKTKDLRLMPDDVIFIPPVGSLAGMAGNVKVPAIYELKGEARILDIIEMAGGTNNISFKNRVRILRIEDGKDQVIKEIDLSEVYERGESNITIRDGDVVKIFPVSQTVDKVVHITGAVKSPGTFGFDEGMMLRDILTFSGGLLRYANEEEAELTRVFITPDGPKTERIIVNLKRAVEGDPQYNLPLREDDYVMVRTVPEWELYRTAIITGEVKFPGTYTIKKGETLSSVIERAGGYTDKAYIKGAVFTRESVRVLQQKQLDEAINRLEQDIISQSAKSIEAALTSEEAQQQQVVTTQRRELISKMRIAKAKGIMAIKLDRLDKFKKSTYDIPLENGDSLFVPEKPYQVQVIGAVYNPTAFVFNPGWTVNAYIKNAGGITRNAEDDDIYILKMDGTAISKRGWSGISTIRWDSENDRWLSGRFMSSTLDPGDTIVIPEKIERIVWLREIKDLTQILYQIAVTAGVLIIAF